MLPMQATPIDEWQRLTAHYRELSDDELRELATDFNDLTEIAQQVLRTEMRSRNLGDPEAPPPASETQQSWSVPRKNFDLLTGPLTYITPDDPADQDKEENQEDDSPLDYTWKTLLCECNETAEALRLSEALRRAGIESWIEAMPKYSIGVGNPRVLVAADQLEQARAIAAQPIPSKIVEESQTQIPDFVPPSCPNCGASDPVLEAVDPANSWKCEQCGERWTESAPAAAEQSPKAG